MEHLSEKGIANVVAVPAPTLSSSCLDSSLRDDLVCGFLLGLVLELAPSPRGYLGVVCRTGITE